MIGLVLEERVVSMMHRTIFACFDSKTIFHELRTEIDDTLVTISGCTIIMWLDDSLRIVNSDLMDAFDN